MIDVATYGPDHLQVVQDHNALGVVLRSLNCNDEALSEFERALAIFEPDHPDVRTTLTNIAAELNHLGRHDEANALAERVRQNESGAAS